MKKLLHVWQSGYPWEVRVGKLNRALVTSGWSVDVACRGRLNEKSEELIDGVQIHRLQSAALQKLTVPIPHNPLWVRFLRNVVKKIKPDIILVRDIPLALDCISVGKKNSIPVILDMAEHYPEAMRTWDKYKKSWILKKLVHDYKIPDLVEKKTIEGVSGVLVVCDEQKARLVNQYGLSGDKIEVVLNTPEVERIQDQCLPKNESKVIFGYHGILCEDRELEVILNGFEMYSKINSNSELVIAGGGESEEKLRKLANTLDCKNRIMFTGRYNPNDLSNLYKQVDFGVVSLRQNIFTENTLANKFFDYPAYGKPFIYPKIKPLESVMNRMNCGVGFAPGNAASVCESMVKIQSQNYSALAESGLASVKKEFNWNVDSKRAVSFINSYCTNR